MRFSCVKAAKFVTIISTMANMQTLAGHLKRTLWWFGRHKVTAVFTVLLLALLMWLFGSWIVWNVQVNSERKEFNSAYNSLREQEGFIDSIGSPAISNSHFCSYRGDPGFGRSWLICEVDLSATYKMVTRQQAKDIDNQLKRTLKRSFLSLHIDNASKDFYELSSYNFKYQDLACDAGTQYYDKEVLSNSIYGDDMIPANSAHVSLSCSGDAKSEYFPVTKD